MRGESPDRGIGGKEPLTREQERDLVRRWAMGDLRARDELVLAHHGLVVGIATSLTKDVVERQELIQEGELALMQALERFDYSRGTRLSTYAFASIRWAMVHALRELRGDFVDFEDRLESATWEEYSREEGLARRSGRKPPADEAGDWW